MRRRRGALSGEVPEHLRVSMLPVFVDDFDQPFAERRARWEEWESEFERLCAARAAWSERHGWPGGDDARVDEESGLIPDEPFDPSKL